MVIKKTNIEKPMFFGASPEIFRRASELRKRMTKAERNLWSALRKKQICGKRFRRQHPIDKFIVDFYCHECKLIIEVDGGIHNKPEQREHDIGRTHDLEQLGLKIIRFTNDQVIFHLR
jgi:very-short-patch-repair endonuclease